MKKNAFITGVSSGIGHALAVELLQQGYHVYGIARRTPDDLLQHESFRFAAVDLRQTESITLKLSNFLEEAAMPDSFDLLFLNAGLFGEPPNFAKETPLDNFNHVISVNLTANKVLLDYFLKHHNIETCVFSSSIAGVRMRAGNLSYSVSKAALNALAETYAIENTDTFFAVIGLCVVEGTSVSRNAVGGPRLEQFPELIKLCERAKAPGYMVSTQTRAKQLVSIFNGSDRSKITNGKFVEIRDLLK